MQAVTDSLPGVSAGRAAEDASRGSAAGAVLALSWREWTRFFRQRNRVIGAVATPLVFWGMLGLGLNHTVAFEPAEGEGLGYLAYFFPGAVVLMVLFTAIFATISIIEDRREGFLQAVLVSPAPRWAIVMGKVLGGSAIAWAQGVLMLLLGAWLVGFPGWAAFAGALGVLALVAVGLTGLGAALAWPMDSTAGFHALMNLLLMPMWLLCGAVFPAATAAGPVRWLMYANPLTYGQWAFSTLWTGGRIPALGVSLPVALVITAGFAAAMLTLATAAAGRRK